MTINRNLRVDVARSIRAPAKRLYGGVKWYYEVECKTQSEGIRNKEKKQDRHYGREETVTAWLTVVKGFVRDRASVPRDLSGMKVNIPASARILKMRLALVSKCRRMIPQTEGVDANAHSIRALELTPSTQGQAENPVTTLKQVAKVPIQP
ncbi:hypothetical protein AAG570_004819 [Ranatra chinensis]|uniref:Uncharacterized protein n=1 Tax=Ranatra chinensis TaxID=642074 RepID=A0ABD0Y1Z6_9HEMI